MHVVKCDQPLDLKEMVFTPRPITVSFLRPLSWEIEEKGGGHLNAPSTFFLYLITPSLEPIYRVDILGIGQILGPDKL